MPWITYLALLTSPLSTRCLLRLGTSTPNPLPLTVPRWPQRRNKIRERITCVTRGLGVVLAGGTFFGSLIDHSASASHCCKASYSPHRDFRRFLRPHPQRPSFRCASCRPAVQFRRASLHSREPAAAQAEAAPRAVPAPLCDGLARMH